MSWASTNAAPEQCSYILILLICDIFKVAKNRVFLIFIENRISLI
jgi:hypothetical protein